MLAFFGASAAGGVIVAGAVTALQIYNPRSSRNLTRAALRTHGAQIEALATGFKDNAALITDLQEQVDAVMAATPSRDEVADAFKKVGAAQRQQQEGLGAAMGSRAAEAERRVNALQESLNRAHQEKERLAAAQEELTEIILSERQQAQLEAEQVEAAVRQLAAERDHFARIAQSQVVPERAERVSAAQQDSVEPAHEIEVPEAPLPAAPVSRPRTEEEAVGLNPLNARKDPASAFAMSGNVKERIAALRAKRAQSLD